MTPQGRRQVRGAAPGQARGLHSARGRWIVAASIVASGAVFLEGTTVNVALPAIARDFGLGVEGLQWVLNGYLLTLTALMLLGGALGDRFRRPAVFAGGCVAFAVTSAGCAVAPGIVSLVLLRVAQGAAGALVVPNSLAMLESAFEGDERGEAIGLWSAWSAVSTAVGPCSADGSWMRHRGAGCSRVSSFSRWRPAESSPGMRPHRRRPAARRRRGGSASPAAGHVDYAGAILVTLGLAGTSGRSSTGRITDSGVHSCWPRDSAACSCSARSWSSRIASPGAARSHCCRSRCSDPASSPEPTSSRSWSTRPSTPSCFCSCRSSRPTSGTARSPRAPRCCRRTSSCSRYRQRPGD